MNWPQNLEASPTSLPLTKALVLLTFWEALTMRKIPNSIIFGSRSSKMVDPQEQAQSTWVMRALVGWDLLLSCHDILLYLMAGGWSNVKKNVEVVWWCRMKGVDDSLLQINQSINQFSFIHEQKWHSHTYVYKIKYNEAILYNKVKSELIYVSI